MTNDDKKTLFEMLKKVMLGYGKQAPNAETFCVWFDYLNSYPIASIRKALDEHDTGFAPVPALIAKRCKELDGRPTADEAWATALTASDESETVIWTTEAMKAFFACKPVLDTGDKIGARMTFRDTYNRLVSDARSKRLSVSWETSLGRDISRRKAALSAAAEAGRIAYTSYPELSCDCDFVSPEIAKKTSDLLKKLKEGIANKEELRRAEIERARQEVSQRKRELQKSVEFYGKGAA